MWLSDMFLKHDCTYTLVFCIFLLDPESALLGYKDFIIDSRSFIRLLGDKQALENIELKTYSDLPRKGMCTIEMINTQSLPAFAKFNIFSLINCYSF